jgi:ribosomal protein S12 methylthiotransferase accessory factor YcaO
MTVQPSVLFIAGLGYSATHLARIWPGPVAGTVRSEAKAEALRASGIDARVWDGDSPLQLPDKACLLVTSRRMRVAAPCYAMCIPDQAMTIPDRIMIILDLVMISA